MTIHEVRTTFRPDRVIEVGDAELIDLTRQGLIVVEDAPTVDESEEAAIITADTESPAPAELEASKKKGGK